MVEKHDSHARLLAAAPEPARAAIDLIKKNGNRVAVLGEFKDGKLELSSEAVAELSRKFPDARFSFVAVNAPFASCRAS
jgi:hypothetical protein